MKKIVLSFCVMFMAINLFAQKTTIAVGEVAGGSNVDAERVTALRSLIISGLASNARINVLDVNNLGMSAANVQLEKLQQYNVQYLVTAKINSMSGSRTYYSGSYTYKAEMQYVVTITDVVTGQVVGSQDKTHYGSSAKGYEGACADTFSLIGADMRSLVGQYFPLSGKIVSIDQSHPKKGAQTVYVEIGSDVGLTAGTPFDVYQVVEVAGQQVRKSIGTGRVKEISSGTLSLCQITKGGMDIQNAINSDVSVFIVTKNGIW
ncbi:MAG: hypothetical protein J5871_00710 [Bacteroidales bacterium]|nr:hypothetical protein [Bacteroidales bacterium]